MTASQVSFMVMVTGILFKVAPSPHEMGSPKEVSKKRSF